MSEQLDYIVHLENTIAILTQSIAKWKEIYKNYEIEQILQLEKENKELKEEIMQLGIKNNMCELKLEKLEIQFLMIEGHKLLEEYKLCDDNV